ncbi:MAG: thermonuclease family protein [Pseudomonadota bacterium]|nr:thermonuclease family protein [Pseudomonadota bacterium]|tara:strand:- start:59 stop:433 length:375 start_codon:yes stop_codon:yes gene_type:complete
MNHILNFFVVLFLLSSNSISQTSIIEGKITHVRDGDTLEIENIPVRLAALDCPENNTPEGRYATKIAKQFEGSQALCELTGAKSYDRFVGYCSINGEDYGEILISQSACRVWKKYDIWERYVEL